jgi:hypothetical protein
MILSLGLPAASQQTAAQQDAAPAQLRTVLRAFYFNLSHQDWEAIAADVLPSKILASRPVPANLKSLSASADTSRCPAGSPALLDEAVIQLNADWAAVLVPHCDLASAAGDEFRLIHFETRWRFVYINLVQEPVIPVSASLTP